MIDEISGIAGKDAFVRFWNCLSEDYSDTPANDMDWKRMDGKILARIKGDSKR